jgi:hypothetical protein
MHIKFRKSREDLNPENKIRFDDMYSKYEVTIKNYHQLLINYAEIKDNVIRIEKKRTLILLEFPYNISIKRISSQIDSIENIFLEIDDTIKKYKLNQMNFLKYFSEKFKLILNEGNFKTMNIYSSDSNKNIDEANNFILKTQTYFKSIQSTFEYYESLTPRPER